MQDPYLASVLELLVSQGTRTDGPHLITRDELLAAGALDVPAAWRKSLGGEERDLFSDLVDEEETPVANDQAARVEAGLQKRPA